LKDELAERVLANVMSWDGPQLASFAPKLQALAHHKYDEYEGYRPGVKFLESLGSWLSQMEPDERGSAVDFVLSRLVFVSRGELDHAIETVYPHVIKPLLLERTSKELNVPTHRIRELISSSVFRELQRKTLILGLSDGARLDRLRRFSPDLSHEQFYLVPELADPSAKGMAKKLKEALSKLELGGTALFRQVLLIDDFTGSGATLLRQDVDATWTGKLWKAHREIERLKGDVIAEDAQVCVIVYISSQIAEENITGRLKQAGLDWRLLTVQRLSNELRVVDGPMVDLCRKYFDPILVDEHLKVGGTGPALGFAGVALPLVLYHNTPNDSISLLWADSSDRSDSKLKRHALFPRRERHQSQRP
jgi:hypothetical protein